MELTEKKVLTGQPGYSLGPTWRPSNQCEQLYSEEPVIYLQPPREKPIVPRTHITLSTLPIPSQTTYYSSYLADSNAKRVERIFPADSINKPEGKLSDITTTKQSYLPVWDIVKPAPIIQKKRQLLNFDGRMQCETTTHLDFPEKYAKVRGKIVPPGHIRKSDVPMVKITTTNLSYKKPTSVQRAAGFKPRSSIILPDVPIASETLTRLSYGPVPIPKKEIHLWAVKPLYQQPSEKMLSETTYLKSFMDKNCISREKPILPIVNSLIQGNEFWDKTVYKESFVPSEVKITTPIVPRTNIELSNDKMPSETTTQFSYLPVYAKRRPPIVPNRRTLITDGSLQSVTTTKNDFGYKMIKPTEMIVPTNHIRFSKKPIEDKTTTAESFMNPACIEQLPNFRPIKPYKKPQEKITSDTVTKLSFKQYDWQPKEKLPWAQKKKYEAPKIQMAADTNYKLNFTLPGIFVKVES